MRRLLLASLVLLAACQTKKEMLNLPWDSGSSKTYQAPFDKVRLSCEDAVRESYYTIKDKESHAVDANRHQILASQGATSGNRYIRIHIENQQSQISVWIVVSSKVDSREAHSADDAVAEDLHKKIAARVAK